MAVATVALSIISCSQTSLASASSSQFNSSPQVLSKLHGSSNIVTIYNQRRKETLTGDLSIKCYLRGNTSALMEESATSCPSLYTVLGIDQNVSLLEIKTAYRQMARKYHPDVCPAGKREESTRIFLQVQDAYDKLSDPERRAEYDYELVCYRTHDGKTLGFSDRSPRKNRRDSSRESWRPQWEHQLGILREKKSREQFSESWGARIRRASASKAM